MFGFIKKGFNKIKHAADGVVHAVNSVAHNHLFQEIAGGVALVFPPAAAGLAVGALAEHAIGQAGHVVDQATHAAAQHIQHGIDASDHLLHALNSKNPIDARDANAVIEHTKQLASQGHADAQRGLVMLYRRAAAHKHLTHFYVDKRSGRVIDKRTGKPTCNSPACAAAHPSHPNHPGRKPAHAA